MNGRFSRRSAVLGALKGAAAGSLAALLGGAGLGAAGLASCAGSSGERRRIEGGFVDDGLGAGHRFRDGGLGPGAGRGREERCRVLVIGGGVAGLSAAWRLARAGVDGIVVTELAGRIGGTSRSGVMSSSAGARLACPFGAHYLPQPRSTQLAVAALLDEAGMATGRTPDGRVAVPDRMIVRDPAERIGGLGFFEEGLWLSAGASGSDFEALARFEAEIEQNIAVDAIGRRLFDLPVQRSSEEARKLDSMSALEWANARGYDSPRMRWYLEYATRDDLGAALGDTSAWALLHYFTARADLKTKESARYLTWPEGNARLVTELRRLSQSGLQEERTSEVAIQVASTEAGGATAVTVNAETGEVTRWRADAVVVATPQFVTRRLLREDPAAKSRASFRYSPWLVANLHLERRPESRGFPFAWDSVLHGSPSLGYVDACHQLDRADAQDTVWTWYLPIIDADERAARQALLERPFETWRDVILDDLRTAHPDIDECVTRIDVWRWGHAMVKPAPGTMWGGMRDRAARSIGR
ncbi:MAG: FAD-dependent oxidoreductase, partial [Planctomycetota bacterium]